jgi:hypothetical protein
MTTEEWLDLIRLYDKDKTTVKDFCSIHSISAASFYKYRRMLNPINDEKFVPITLKEVDNLSFECNGYTLSVSNDISTDNLAQIMKATLK